MRSEYLRVIPSTATYDPAAVSDTVRTLQNVTPEPDESSVLADLFGTPPSATFEFVILSAGGDAPVEFYYGTDDSCLGTLEAKLENLYPRTFTIRRVSTDPVQRILPHFEYDESAFDSAASAGALWVDADTPSGDTPADTVQETVTDRDRQTLDNATGPVRREDGTILAQPSLEELRPVGLRWHGVGTRRRDWMCRLTSYHGTDAEQTAASHPPLAELIDHIAAAEVPLAYQVVFRRRAAWSGDRAKRERDIRRGGDTRLQQLGNSIGDMLWGSPGEPRAVEELDAADQQRLAEMESVDDSGTFVATVRALCLQNDSDHGTPLRSPVSAENPETAKELPRALGRLQGSLGALSGEFYELDPTRIQTTGILSVEQSIGPQNALQRFQHRELSRSDRGRSRPQVVAAPDTLAGLITVPSASEMSIAGARETRAQQQTETPLPKPNPDKLSSFRRGMAVGYPLDSEGQAANNPVRLPPQALTRHYARYGPTGAGKSTAIQNDVLSLHATTEGPTVLIDRKGDGMVENYMRAHYARFGSLNDIYCLSMPEILPAVPFFDIRPGLAAGRERSTVAQEKVEHFRELLRLVMGEDLFEQAFVANEVLAFITKALFDPQYQYDAFGLTELYDAVRAMQIEKQVPPTSRAFGNVVEPLSRQFEKSDAQFRQTMDAVLNRLDKIQENTHLTTVLRSVPDWDETTEQYESGTFDFRRLLDQDAVVLLDMGALRRESSRALTLVLLSNLWDALQYQRGDAQSADIEDRQMINLIIDEAAPLVASPLVHEDLLPQGRSFGLSLGLVMQFPEQVKTATGSHDAGRRAYQELLSNVHTQIVGGIRITDALGETLVAEDLDVSTLRQRHNQLPAGEWLVDLPQVPFLETPAEPFSIQSLPIPAGHPESDAPLSQSDHQSFVEVREAVLRRSQTEFGTDGTSSASASTIRSATTEPGSDSSSGAERADEHEPETIERPRFFETSSDREGDR